MVPPTDLAMVKVQGLVEFNYSPLLINQSLKTLLDIITMLLIMGQPIIVQITTLRSILMDITVRTVQILSHFIAGRYILKAARRNPVKVTSLLFSLAHHLITITDYLH